MANGGRVDGVAAALDGGVVGLEDAGGAVAPDEPEDEEEDGEGDGGGPVGAEVFGEEGVVFVVV